MSIKNYSTKTNLARGIFAFTGLSLVIVMVTASFVLTGCGNKKTAPSPVATQPAPNTPTPEPAIQSEAPAPVAVSAGDTNVNTAPDFTKINIGIRGWRMEHGRMPTNFDEFAATCGFYIPPPPPGKKYTFDAKLHASLVNR